MTDLGAFPNIKTVLIAILSDLAPVSTAVPPDYDGTTPRLRIRVYGGSDTVTSDFPRFDIDALAGGATISAAEQAADALAEQVRQRLISGSHKTVHGLLDKVTTDTRPNTVPYSDTIANTTAAYRGALRRG